MSIAAAAIVNAIVEALDGTMNSTRDVDAAALGGGVFEGQPVQAQQSRAIQTADKRHRFDVRLMGQQRHASSPASIKASHRTALVPVQIDITTTLKTTAQESERFAQRASVASDADDAIQALTYPGNLTTDDADTATGIVSGMLFGPDGSGQPQWSVVSEDWSRHLLKSVIRGSAIVVVAQAVA
jgi:hypothetical protein